MDFGGIELKTGGIKSGLEGNNLLFAQDWIASKLDSS